MKRMWSKNELKSIADTQAKAVQKDITTLVDKDGHPRFIEGDISVENLPEGVTKTYGKWSLSGTHLLIVLGLSCADESILPAFTSVGDLQNLPTWIFDKIAVLFSSNIVDQRGFAMYNASGSSQTLTTRLYKTSDKIAIAPSGAITLTDARNVRIAYDLLIDNA